MCFMVLRPVSSSSVKRVADSHLFRLFHHTSDEFVVYPFLDEEAASGYAILTFVEEY